MGEIDNKLKEAHKLADKELLKMYWNKKIFGIAKKYWLSLGVISIFISCALL